MRLLYIICCLFISGNAFATDLYVDTTAGACTGNYSISSRDCSGSDGNSYATVQAAITAMSGGDDIYLRGGTYLPLQLTGNSASGEVGIPQSKDGSSENWSSIQSYPGEWAILDGDNKCGARGAVLGLRDWDKDGATDIKYWKFERLEITGGASTDLSAASGIWGNGGPFIVRYCYIHDNLANTGGANPCGIKGMVWEDSTVEYNYFKDNGSNGSSNEIHSVTGPQIHSDYLDGVANWESAPVDFDHATKNNTIQYNLFNNANSYAYSGIHYKSRQYLTPKTNVSWTYEDQGDKIHHNIFLNHLRSIGLQQDFAQVYNNIMVTPTSTSSQIGITVVDDQGWAGQVATVIYNNTLIKGRLLHNFGYSTYVVNPYIYIYNNLFDQAPANGDGSAVIDIGDHYMQTTFTYESARVDLTNNYLYRGSSTDIRVTRNTGGCYSYLSPSEYDACYTETNYNKTSSEGSDNLYSSGYLTRGAHVVEGAVTIAGGGHGGSHPYLDGVTLPSYIGATNPDDNDWVAGVLALDVSYFTSQTAGSDPTWIEGESEPEVPANAIQGVSIQ